MWCEIQTNQVFINLYQVQTARIVPGTKQLICAWLKTHHLCRHYHEPRPIDDSHTRHKIRNMVY
jgi:hypothetical protein